MNIGDRAKHAAKLLVWAVQSVPMLAKMVGMGALVAACFGSITFVRTRDALRENIEASLAQKVTRETASLATYLSRPVSVHDIVVVREILEDARVRHPGILYIIVRNPDGTIMTHTFNGGIPAGLAPVPTFNAFPGRDLRVFSAERKGLVYEALRPIMNGRGGHVQLGWSYRAIAEELASVRNAILTSLAICSVIGIGVALLLSLAITHPVYHLSDAVQQISRNNLDARATVFSNDEIGRLASAFNEMAETLSLKDSIILEKEAARAMLVQGIITAQERERKAISRELHDQIGQSLLALLLQMRSQDGDGGSGLEASHTRYKDWIEDLIEDVRRVSRGMHPAVLDDYGLDSALANYVKEIGDWHTVHIDYQSAGAGDVIRLSEEEETAFYRIAQEAITNALRHSDASSISVILLIDSESATLMVEDDGTGFEADLASPARTGLGLLSMRERCSLFGGDLDIMSRRGEGTTVRARIPLRREGKQPA